MIEGGTQTDGPQTDGSGSGGPQTGTSEGPGCASGDVALPATVPMGWTGWSWVAIGELGSPPPGCPAGTDPRTLYLGEQSVIQCACACDDPQVCGTTFSVGAGCDMVTPQGPLNLCQDLAVPAVAIDLSTTPSPAQCVAQGLPLFNEDVTPIAVCALPGAGDGCVAPMADVLGPCITGTAAACPTGYSEVVATATAVSCAECDPCASDEYCQRLGYELFGLLDCAGEPVAIANDAANCMAAPPFQSLRAGMPDRLDTGCDASAAVVETQRICCLEP